MLGQLDSMVQTYFIAQSQRGCVVNTSITNATACAFIQRFPQAIGNIDLESTAQVRSLFKQTGFVKRQKASSKFEIPDAARKEIEFLFHHEFVTCVEKFNIPPSFILNLHQTPLKYVPVSQETMAPRGSTAVTIKGSNDKRMITGTFLYHFFWKVLTYPTNLWRQDYLKHSKGCLLKEYQLQCQPQSLLKPRKSLKFLKEIVIPYVDNERCPLKLPKEQKVLMVTDVFTGHMKEYVVKQYQNNNILIANVPRNMNKYYQPLDLTVNEYCKRFWKRKFTQWYSAEVTKQLANKVALEDVQVKR